MLLMALTLAAAGLLVTAVSSILLVGAGILFGVFLHGLSQFIADRTPLPYRGRVRFWLVAAIVASIARRAATGQAPKPSPRFRNWPNSSSPPVRSCRST